ncbi:F-box domain cyclin-like protein [Macrophomina phaseolina MS6]|uniref:F-box domain cyclin-like protein n=1 Tax=Macrophomina phaseolina (strain MS6) TaxID=1126212 RepID=K2R8Z1_MACPH|nr:F-box domain cyclin-like protein [Macrophomina phaseolina MS6]
MAPPDVKAFPAIHLAKSRGRSDAELWNEKRLSRGTISLAMNAMMSEKYCRKHGMQTIPVELGHEIAALLDLQSLIKLRGVSRHWRDIVNDCELRERILHPDRRALLQLYDDVIETPGFLKSRPEVLSRIVHFDRDKYIGGLPCHPVPSAFEMWIREWPSKAVIGSTWPGFPDPEKEERKHWWRTKAANKLHKLDHIPAAFDNRTAQLLLTEQALEGKDWNSADIAEDPDYPTVQVQADMLEIARQDDPDDLYDFLDGQAFLVFQGASFLNGKVWTGRDFCIIDSYDDRKVLSWPDFLRGQAVKIGKAWAWKHPAAASLELQRMTGLDLGIRPAAFEDRTRRCRWELAPMWRNLILRRLVARDLGQQLPEHEVMFVLAAAMPDMLAEIDCIVGIGEEII